MLSRLFLRLGLQGSPRARVVHDVAVTAGARGAQLALALLGNVLSARTLGPAEFGRFGLVMAVVLVFSTLADGGLTYAAIRDLARRHGDDPVGATVVARAYAGLRFAGGALMAGVGVLLAEPLAGLLAQPALKPLLQLAFGALLALGISSYPSTILIGLGAFDRLGVASILNGAITVAGIAALWAAGALTLGTLVAWNVVLPVVSTLPAWWLLPPGWLPWRPASVAAPPGATWTAARGLVRFGGWIGLSLLGSMLMAQGDVLLLGRLAPPAVLGVYSVAVALATRLDTLNQSLFTVLMPRASRLAGRAALRQYSRQVLTGAMLLAVALGAAALLAQPAIAWVYGARYADAAPLFLVLLAIVLFDLATGSLVLLIFPLNRPRALAATEWLRVAVLGGAGVLLIPIWGAWGAVAARGLARVTGTAGLLSALRRALRE